MKRTLAIILASIAFVAALENPAHSARQTAVQLNAVQGICLASMLGVSCFWLPLGIWIAG